MGKFNFNSTNNALTSVGLLNVIDSKIDQPVLKKSNVSFNSINSDNDITCQGNLIVSGNATILGTTTVINTDTVVMKDNLILINSEESGAGITANLSGVEIERGTLSNFQTVYEESTDLYKIGPVGNLQAVATREDSPLSKGIMVYNNTLGRIDSTTSIELPITFTGNEVSSNSATGTVRIQGGLGITGDISLDKSLRFLGTDYTSNIKSNLANDLLITSGNNISFIQSSGDKFNLSDNVAIVLGSSGSQTIANPSGTALEISNVAGNINLNTQSAGKVILPEQTLLNWGANANYMTFDGSNMVLNSASNFTVNAATTNLSSSTVSSSPSTGALTTSGGVGISNTTNASSSANGGTITTSGGMGVTKDLYIGGSTIIGDTNTTVVKGPGIGLNLMSIAKTLTNPSLTGVDISFNSFSGGIIDTASAPNEVSTVFIGGAPSVIGGGSIANPFALVVNSGKTKFSGDVSITTNTLSSSVSTGSLITSGGIGISNTTNAISSANGGTFTSAGGMGVTKDLYIGGSTVVGELPTSVSQVANTGVTFRSLNKTLTTTNSANTSFNTFEGGSIISSATIPQSSTVFINAPPTISGGGTITNPFALVVNQGDSLFNGKVVSADTSLDSIKVSGGINITNTNFPALIGDQSSLTTLGGASVSKNLLVGNFLKTNNGTGSTTANHLILSNGNLGRFSFGLKGTESSGNQGSNLELNSYDDTGASLAAVLNVSRSNSNITLNSVTSSTSPSSAGLVISGGLSISNTVDATSVTNGGTFTTGGGASVAKKLFVGGDTNLGSALTTVGTTNLNKTIVNTNNGSFDISGTNGISATVANTSNITTTSGTLTLAATNGTTTISGSSGLTASSAGNISITSGGNTTIANASGNITSTSVSNTTTTTAGSISLSSSNAISLTGGSSGGISLQTTDNTLGVRIATATAGIPTEIGTSLSETTVNGDLTVKGGMTIMGTTTTIESTIVTINDNSIVVNSAPAGISDGGLLIRRFQTPNNTGLGEVVNDAAKFTGTFTTGSNTPTTLALSASGSSVDGYYNGWWIKITSGPAAGVVRRIKEYYGSTKMATIYSTSDNVVDGLDLSAVPISGNSYGLFDSPYIGFYFSESTGQVMVSGVSADIGTGQFRNPTSYYPIHVKSLIAEEGITLSGDLNLLGRAIVLGDNTNTLFAGTSGNKPIFNVDTVAYTTTYGSPSNTVGTGHIMNFTGLNSVLGDTIYSSIISTINNNTVGTLESKLGFSVNAGVSGIQELLSISGTAGGTSTFNSLLRITNSVASSSISSASTVLSGGLSINNATEATSADNGGTFTTGGGAAIKKKLFTGGNVNIGSSSGIANTSNTVAIDTSSLNTNGDITLYNGTKQSIFFSGAGSGIPSYTTRSVGSKLVLKPSISASTVDTGLGVSGADLWASVPDSTAKHSFYLGNAEYLRVANTGITLQNYDTGIVLAGGATIKAITGDKVLISPQNNLVGSGVIFTDSTGAIERVKINGVGQIQANTVSTNASTNGQGSILEISGSTITDQDTTASGTIPLVSLSKINQSTLAATNSSVITSVAASQYIAGPVIKGTNESLANTSALYIDSVNSINTSGDTVPLATSLFIKNSPSGNNITKSRAILVESGVSEFGGRSVITASGSLNNSSNTIDNTVSALSILGDLALYNGTKQTIYFSGAGNGVPSYTTRTDGSKLVLSPSIGATSVDTAIGTNSAGEMWSSVPDSTGKHSFYLGTLQKVQINNTGLAVDSGTSNSAFTIYSNTQDAADNKGIIIAGGGSNDVSRGSSIELYGNEYNSGNVVVSSGVSGTISLKTNAIERIAVSTTGETLFSSTTDSTSLSSSSSIKTLGGISIAKTASIGNSLNLDFNQPYLFSGESSGALNVQSQVTTVDSTVKHFTKDGDNSTGNNILLYGLGTPSSQTNTELLKVGYTLAGGYMIKTESSGSGVSKPLVLQSNNNTAQLQLNTDSTVSLSSTTATTSSVSGALRIAGGLGISNTTDATSATNGGSITTAGGLAVAKKVFIGSDLTVGGNFTITGTVNIPHSGVTGLLNDDHTQYALLAGRTGGQVITGGTAANNNTTIRSTTSATKGAVIFDETTATTSSASGALQIAGGLGISNTADATSATNGGTITTAGGLAVAKKAFIGTDLDVGGNLTVTGIAALPHANFTGLLNDDHTQYTLLAGRTGGQTITGGTAASNNTTIRSTSNITKGAVIFDETTATTSSASGALQISGGLGISNTTDATSATNGGTLTTAGGLAVAKKAFVGTDLAVGGNLTVAGIAALPHANFTGLLNDDHTQYTLLAGRTGGQVITGGTAASNNTTIRSTTSATKGAVIFDESTASTSSASGALQIAGGLGISNTTDATSATNGGTITSAGGLAVAKKAFVGTDLAVGGNLTVTGIAALPHANFTGLLNDDHTQYALLAGRTGGQTITGGTAASNNTTIRSTMSATKGAVIFDETTATTSSASGALQIAGGLGISNTMDATNATNGGTITTAGGIAVAKKAFVGTDLDVGGNLTVTGTVAFGITSPSITTTNNANTTSTATCTKTILTRNGNTRTLSAIFRVSPTAQGISTFFTFALPDLATNLVNNFDIAVNTTGYNNDSVPNSVENLFGFGVSGTTNARIKFTAASTSAHTIQVIVNYTV